MMHDLPPPSAHDQVMLDRRNTGVVGQFVGGIDRLGGGRQDLHSHYRIIRDGRVRMDRRPAIDQGIWLVIGIVAYFDRDAIRQCLTVQPIRPYRSVERRPDPAF
jgi:hypothetical protein